MVVVEGGVVVHTYDVVFGALTGTWLTCCCRLRFVNCLRRFRRSCAKHCFRLVVVGVVIVGGLVVVVVEAVAVVIVVAGCS